MKKMLHLSAALIAIAMIAGCATVPEQVATLQTENTGLKKDVSDRNAQIQALADEKAKLQQELDYQSKRAKALDKEKTARITDASDVRKGVREFADQLMASLQTYLQRADIVDYLGNELVSRAKTEERKDTLLVDLDNTVKANGTVIGGRAFLTGPARLQFCLIRPDETKSKYTVAAMSTAVSATAGGLQSWTFDLPVAAKKGDLIGAYFPDELAIPFDDVDTGQTVTAAGPIRPDASVTISYGSSRNKRAYSFGIVGYFEETKTPAPAEPVK